jgi:hypothetical protein
MLWCLPTNLNFELFGLQTHHKKLGYQNIGVYNSLKNLTTLKKIPNYVIP